MCTCVCVTVNVGVWMNVPVCICVCVRMCMGERLSVRVLYEHVSVYLCVHMGVETVGVLYKCVSVSVCVCVCLGL